MLPDQLLLRIPGPSPIPPSVQRAMSQPMIGHRGADNGFAAADQAEIEARIRNRTRCTACDRQRYSRIGSGSSQHFQARR